MGSGLFGYVVSSRLISTTTLAVGTTKLQFSIPANGFATVRKQ